jgi:Domain of unknown function (DUF6285)
MHDLPRGAALLALAREVMVNNLMPLLPPERRLDALLVANCMAIAEREAAIEEGPWLAIHREMEMLSGPLSPVFSPCGESEGRAQREGEVAADLLLRLARELRIGAFENSPDREARARAILWRLTIAKLRLANPKFLTANGFA